MNSLYTTLSILLILIIVIYEYELYIFGDYITKYIKYDIFNYDFPNMTELDKIAITTTLNNLSEERKIKPSILTDSIKYYIRNNYDYFRLIEAELISINKINLSYILTFFKFIRSLKKHNHNTINKYISFTRFSRGMDKILCDWCSIANGCMELLLDTVYENITNASVHKLLNNEFIIQLNGFLYFTTMLKLNKKPLQRDLDKYYSKINLLHTNKKQIKKLIYDILTVREIFEDIETRWCPFKHMTQLNFDRLYYKYNANDVNELKIASNIMKKYGEIKCNKCIELLNKSPQLNKHSYTIFKDYMTRIDQILTT